MISITMENEVSTLEELYIAGLFEENFLEADPRSLKYSFELNLESCYNLLEAEMMKIIVIRDDTRPVGYFIYNIVPKDLFTKDCVASSICLYIKPEYRGGLLLTKVIQFAEKVAQEQGASVLHIALTPNTSSLERLGYNVDNIVYSKILGV